MECSHTDRKEIGDEHVRITTFREALTVGATLTYTTTPTSDTHTHTPPHPLTPAPPGSRPPFSSSWLAPFSMHTTPTQGGPVPQDQRVTHDALRPKFKSRDILDAQGVTGGAVFLRFRASSGSRSDVQAA